MATTTSSTVATTTTPIPLIKEVTDSMTLYVPIILLIVGIVGCLCNFITFTSRQLRNNPCAFYFLCSSVFEFLSLPFGLITRLAADHFDSTLQNTNQTFCKLRAYLISALPLVATYFVLLAAIDRYMSSSIHARLRAFSQIKIAHRVAIIAVAVGLITPAHILVSYDLRPKCATLRGAYAMFDSMFVIVWHGFLPHLMMLVFGFGTFMNIKRARKQIATKPQGAAIAGTGTTTNRQQRRDQKTDAQLIVMMLVQVGLSSVLILTRMIYYAYYVLGPTLTGYDRLVGSFMMSFTTLLYYANYAKSFYIYTLSSQFFRTVFLQTVKISVQQVLGQYIPNFLLKSNVNPAEVAEKNIATISHQHT